MNWPDEISNIMEFEIEFESSQPRIQKTIFWLSSGLFVLLCDFTENQSSDKWNHTVSYWNVDNRNVFISRKESDNKYIKIKKWYDVLSLGKLFIFSVNCIFSRKTVQHKIQTSTFIIYCRIPT